MVPAFPTRLAKYDSEAGTDKLNKISRLIQEHDRSYRGFNFFDPENEDLLAALSSGEFNMSCFQNKDLRRRVKEQLGALLNYYIRGV